MRKNGFFLGGGGGVGVGVGVGVEIGFFEGRGCECKNGLF